MRWLGKFDSLALSILGVMIALIGPAAAVPSDFRVPEPMSALVFGAGLVGAAVIRRRKK